MNCSREGRQSLFCPNIHEKLKPSKSLDDLFDASCEPTSHAPSMPARRCSLTTSPEVQTIESDTPRRVKKAKSVPEDLQLHRQSSKPKARKGTKKQISKSKKSKATSPKSAPKSDRNASPRHSTPEHKGEKLFCAKLVSKFLIDVGIKTNKLLSSSKHSTKRSSKRKPMQSKGLPVAPLLQG